MKGKESVERPGPPDLAGYEAFVRQNAREQPEKEKGRGGGPVKFEAAYFPQPLPSAIRRGEKKKSGIDLCPRFPLRRSANPRRDYSYFPGITFFSRVLIDQAGES